MKRGIAAVTPVPRLRTRVTPRARKITAAALLVTVVAIEFVLSVVPLATRLDGQVAAHLGSELVLAGVQSDGALLAHASRADEAADIRFDKARLAPETFAALRTLGFEVSDADNEISWITGAQRGSRTVFEVSTDAAGAPPAELSMRVLPGIGGKHAQLEIATHGAPVHVLIGTPFAPEEGTSASMKLLTVGERKIQLPGALPLKIILADGSSVRAQFANPGIAQPARFVLGQPPLSTADAGGLRLRWIGVRTPGRSDLPYDYLACAAEPGSIAWRGAVQLTAACNGASAGLITLNELAATPGALEVKMQGSGWSLRSGKLVTPDTLSRVAENKVLAGIAVAVNVALASWLLLEVFGPMLGRVRGRWSGGIFISYRREDSAAQAGRLHDHLTTQFGAKRVFMDVDGIGLGEDFARRIRENLEVTDALLAVIGPRWLEARHDSGARRLDDPGDFVRIEIVTALERGAFVIPVLVGGARMPRENELPLALAPLARLNAIEISDSKFTTDLRVLIESLAQGRAEDLPAAAPAHSPDELTGRA